MHVGRWAGALRASLVVVAALACRDSRSLPADQIDQLSQRLDRLERRVRKIELGGEPDPQDVFSVPIDGDPYRGPDIAKVTLVEAFEFA